MAPQSPKTFPEILEKVRFYGPGPPGTLECGLILALGGSSNPHRPPTVGHAKDQRTQRDPKRTKAQKGPSSPFHKKWPGHKILKRVKNGQNSIFRANFKDNGDKPPSWMMPKANQDEKYQRGSISWPIMGIYVHITISNHFLR
ncbi:hypothetical protein O181_098571 [Austropuccinia psidii MF-1]|uniref:Uncharacterized protein n=1 Tax=Austropuccinia psidii MF-1 TaxID=1389203 RepID=A0A9Q3JBN0_9BASI|nr:hypothetical protein [Austropuccinia psidii MF-1]